MSSRFISWHCTGCQIFPSLCIYSFIYVGMSSLGPVTIFYCHYFFDAQIVPDLGNRTSSSQFLCPFNKSLHSLNICLLSAQEDVSGLFGIFLPPALETVIPSRSLSFFQWRNQGVFSDTAGMGADIIVSRLCQQML